MIVTSYRGGGEGKDMECGSTYVDGMVLDSSVSCMGGGFKDAGFITISHYMHVIHYLCILLYYEILH